MARHFLLKSSLLLGAALLGSVAQAQVQREKDWALERRIDSLLGVQSCVASTTVASSQIPVRTEIILPETDEKAPLIVLKAQGLAGQKLRAYVRPDSKTQYPLLLIGQDPVSGEDVFVLSPLRLPETLNVIAEKNTLDIYFGEGSSAILARVSLKGSAVTINRAAACRATKVILNQVLFNELKRDAHLAQAQPGSVQEMLEAYQATLRLLKEKDVAQMDLLVHQRGTQAVLAEEQAARNQLAVASQREQDTANTIASIKKRIADLQASLAQANKDLPNLQKQRPAAQSAVDAAERAIAPHVPQVQRLESDVASAQSDESRAAASVRALQNQLAQLQQDIRNLENETDSLRRQQQNRDNELRAISSQLSDLEFKLRNYDERREAERILRDNPSYRNEQRELERWTRTQSDLLPQIEIARKESMEADRALKQCLARRDDTLIPPKPAPEKPAEREKGKGDGLKPPVPVDSAPGEPAKPQPPRDAMDCTPEQNRANQARRNLEQKQSELQRADREVQDARNTLARLENNARNEAREGRERLLSQINTLQQQQRNIQNDIANMDRRIRDIQQIDIPRKMRESDIARSELSSAQNALANASSRLRNAQNSLAQYKASVGYDRLQANLSNAVSALDQLDSAIARAQRIQKDAPGQISSSQAEQARQEQELVLRKAAREQAELNLSDASSRVLGHRQREAELADVLRLKTEEYAQAKVRTQGISKALYGY